MIVCSVSHTSSFFPVVLDTSEEARQLSCLQVNKSSSLALSLGSCSIKWCRSVVGGAENECGWFQCNCSAEVVAQLMTSQLTYHYQW